MANSKKMKKIPKYKGGSKKGINDAANKFSSTANKAVKPVNKTLDVVDHIKKRF